MQHQIVNGDFSSSCSVLLLQTVKVENSPVSMIKVKSFTLDNCMVGVNASANAIALRPRRNKLHKGIIVLAFIGPKP